MAVREDCRHYVGRSTAGNEKIEMCRLGAAEDSPFACPEGCLFFEPRRISRAGFELGDTGDQTD